MSETSSSPEQSSGELHEDCARRGGVCDCNGRPCAVAFREYWFAEMRDTLPGISEERLGELWIEARKLGREAAEAAEGS